MRFSRAKPVGTFRVYQPSSRRVAAHPETLREARINAKFWAGLSGSPMEIQERFPSGGWVTLETVEPKGRATKTAKRSHATRTKHVAVADLSSRQRGLLRDLRRAKNYDHPLSVEVSKSDVAWQLADLGLLRIEPDDDLGLTWVTVTDRGRKIALAGGLWRGV